MLKGKTCIPLLAVRNFWDVFAEERRNCHFMSPWLRKTNLKLLEVSELIKQAKSISHCTSKQRENKRTSQIRSNARKTKIIWKKKNTAYAYIVNAENSGVKNCLPEKPGVNDASFLARLSLFKTVSSFRGLRWTLKIDALPFISGGPLTLKE